MHVNLFKALSHVPFHKSEISAEACDAGFELTESTEMGGGYRVPCVHAMISLQNSFSLHVHWACKTNYFQLFLHYACSYPVWSYFFLAAPVGYSTRTFAAPFALKNRCSNCSKSWVMNVVSCKVHCTMRKKNGRRMISWSWHLASLGNWIWLVLLKLYGVSTWLVNNFIGQISPACCTQEDRGRQAYHGRTADLMWMEVYDEPIRIYFSDLVRVVWTKECR